MSDFDLTLAEQWMTYAEAWLALMDDYPRGRDGCVVSYAECLVCFSQAMASLRKFWPERK